MNAILGLLGRGPALCLGIDPHPSLLAGWGLEDDPAGLERFGATALEGAIRAGTRIVKPQVSFYERHGAAGFAVLERLIRAARAEGVAVIADAKRGDIGSTMAGYAAAWLEPGAPLESDALTLSPFLGLGSLAPALDAAAAHDKLAFVLAATSNPEGASVQNAVAASGLSVTAAILEGVTARNATSPRPHVGVVIGATLDIAALGLDAAPTAPILAPGFGAQGARLADARARFGAAADRVVANVAREALAGPPEGLAERLGAMEAELAA